MNTSHKLEEKKKETVAKSPKTHGKPRLTKKRDREITI